ncbi:T9SS type A sorting domain-containing protein [Pontibacter sp. G13]|uniref:DUF7619 domain-containing protein n=1 Tax=Pontibacter sp. G13 TaxID=3074898 RepID=UPI00288A2F45|nr:T9SS type A sorting domain-containing protein [Pontibacter sp. G13]WNJ19523.1 T9SS type A sorting domain-containing protein [Pontibacter sp. G13]
MNLSTFGAPASRLGWLMKVCLLSAFCYLGFSSQTYATHYIGGDMYIEHDSGCNWFLYSRRYFDCSGGAFSAYIPLGAGNVMPPESNFELSMLTSGGCLSPLPLGAPVLISNQEVTQLAPGVISSCFLPGSPVYGMAEVVYRHGFSLCDTAISGCQFIVDFDVCCTSSTMTSGMANEAMYRTMTIPWDAFIDSSNTPPFPNGNDIITHGMNGTYIYDLSMTDPDGDSLVYELATMTQQAGVPMGYSAGYSPLSPMGPHYSISLGLNGFLTISPDSMPTYEQTMLKVKTTEYRNGVILGIYERDVFVLVVDDQSNVQTLLDTVTFTQVTEIADWEYSMCAGLTGSWDMVFTDSDSTDTLSLYTNIQNYLPGAVVTTSGTNPLNVQISWTPSAQYAGQTLNVPIEIVDGASSYFTGGDYLMTIHVAANCLDATVVDTECDSTNGSISLSSNILGIQYLWSTGDTTSSISDLGVGYYYVSYYDGSGVPFGADTFFISANELSAVADSIVTPSCGQADGEIHVSVTGGTGPYTLLWSTGDTTSSLTGVAAGDYWLTITDSMGCMAVQLFTLAEDDSCVNIISGVVYFDMNGNCQYDSTDIPIPYVLVTLNTGDQAFTDANGVYEMQVGTGVYLTSAVSMSALALTADSACASIITQGVFFSTTGQVENNLHFPVSIGSDFNLFVHEMGPVVAPGATTPAYLSYMNIGGGVSPSTTTVSWTHDPSVTINFANPPMTTYDPATRTGTWALGSLIPFQGGQIHIMVTGDTSAVVGDTACFSSIITPFAGDSDTTNNIDTLKTEIVASYDPNDKQVSPAGIGPLGLIEADQQDLTYTVRFQNTGNFPAIKVVVRDTLDPSLPASSILVIGASHNFSLAIEDDNVLVWTFDNIWLPDSASNPAGSIGYLSYRVSHDGTAPIGTSITNRAAIYFDYNDPIFTNETVNTIFAYPQVSLSAPDTLCGDGMLDAAVISDGLPPYQFDWSTGASTADPAASMTEPTVSGWYWVQVTDALGVTALDSQYVEVIPLPEADFQYNVQGLTVSLLDVSMNATSISWSVDTLSGASSESLEYTFAGPGVYDVTLIVENECGMDTVTYTIPVDAVSIDPTIFGQVEVAPNPFQDATQITFENTEMEEVSLILRDLQGREVKVIPAQRTDRFTLNREGLAPGLYLFELKGKESYVGKVVIE